MAFTVTFSLLILSCAIYMASADVSSLRSNRHFGRVTTRLQRLEASRSGPYAAAGYRPNREFNLPNERPQSQAFFPSQQRPQTNFDQATNEIQRPALLYGAPGDQQQTQQTFNTPQRTFAPPQQNYAAPQQQQQQLQQTYAAPQQTYAAPEETQRLTADAEVATAPLSDNREETEDEEDTAASDIAEDVSTSQAEESETKTVVASAQPTTNVAYYPGGAVNFVHPLAAYIQPTYAKLQAQPYAAAAFVTSAPFIQAQQAAYVAAAPVSSTFIAAQPAKVVAAAPAKLVSAAAPAKLVVAARPGKLLAAKSAKLVAAKPAKLVAAAPVASAAYVSAPAAAYVSAAPAYAAYYQPQLAYTAAAPAQLQAW